MKNRAYKKVMSTAAVALTSLLIGCSTSPTDLSNGNSSSVGNSVISDKALAGRVITVDDSIPVTGAELTLRSQDSTSTFKSVVHSDSVGAYLFEDIGVGEYTLAARKDGKVIMCDNSISIESSDGVELPDREAFAFGSITGVVNFLNVDDETINKKIDIFSYDLEIDTVLEAGQAFTLTDIPEGTYKFGFYPQSDKIDPNGGFFSRYIDVTKGEVTALGDINYTYLFPFEMDTSFFKVKEAPFDHFGLAPDSAITLKMTHPVASVESVSLINSENDSQISLTTEINECFIKVTLDKNLESAARYNFSIVAKNEKGDLYELENYGVYHQAVDSSFAVVESNVMDPSGQSVSDFPVDAPIVITMNGDVKLPEAKLMEYTDLEQTELVHVPITIVVEENKVIITPERALKPNWVYTISTAALVPEDMNKKSTSFTVTFNTGS